MYIRIYACGIQISMAARTLVFLNCCRTNSIFNIVRSVHVANFTLFKQHFNKLDYNQSNYLIPHSLNFSLKPNNLKHLTYFKRFKHSKKKSKGIEEDDDEEEELDPELQLLLQTNKNAKVAIVTAPSLRLDAVVHHGMAISRNKVEAAFYDSKIRLNGKLALKKACQVTVNDEIDFIQGVSPKNPKCLLVTRITILKTSSTETGYKVKVLREKSLMIENYEEPWMPISNET
ncbi:mitochondrial transcription rescue factor 1 [Chelonus insularis]|uniref:mitochondrial transcription rescue factor 1 n=1 Tax=Chelonus insularis TaxID=460826 RepID=UPI00158932E0|nr:mitochondrial transcription rescue factor 1 [Chelonus insularis]